MSHRTSTALTITVLTLAGCQSGGEAPRPRPDPLLGDPPPPAPGVSRVDDDVLLGGRPRTTPVGRRRPLAGPPVLGPGDTNAALASGLPPAADASDLRIPDASRRRAAVGGRENPAPPPVERFDPESIKRYDDAERLLKRWGVTEYRLRQTPEKKWHFEVTVPSPDNVLVRRLYEFSHEDSITAVRAVLTRIHRNRAASSR